MTEGGKVFYTTSEGLVLADTNEKRDAYEWSGGANIGNISTGRSISDSTLLSVSRDGKDAYFFTRDVLVPSDENGGAVKIYDAREKGGYLTFPSPKPCAASDECHGAGTEPPPPPDINSVNGTGEEQRLPKTTTTCRRGFVKRHGSCVRKHRRKHRRASHRSGGNG